jgi:PAS domain S-box-containing protein
MTHDRAVRLLLIEDNSGDARLIRELLVELREEGFELRVSTDLATGLRRLDEERIDALLLDLGLPDSDGLSTLARARAHPARVPIVVLSGHSDGALGTTAVAQGAQDYLVKGDFDGPLLARTIRYAIARQRQEEALGRLAAIVESAEEAILAKTLEGVITDWNRAAERLYGYSAEEAIGKSVSLLVPPDRREELSRILEATRTGNSIEDLETVRVRKDGTRLDVSLTVSPIRNSRGHILGASALARDIGPRKALEQMRSDLVSMLSHDIKTPITAILGFVQLRRRDAPTEPEDLYFLDRIEANAHGALHLAINFVDAVRMESGEFRLHVEEVSLNDIVRHVLRHQESRARTRDIELEMTFAPDLPMLEADQRLLDRLVSNLVSNALKFSPERGRIRVSTAMRRDRLWLSVADQGPGIAQQDRSRLFQRYGVLTERRPDSTGLGLFIVKKIADSHGAVVELECPPEGGSVFTVSFPRRLPPPE